MRRAGGPLRLHGKEHQPMSAAEYFKSLEHNRLTYVLFARVIGVDAHIARRWGDESRLTVWEKKAIRAQSRRAPILDAGFRGGGHP
jgi:hypothetical protein